MRSRSKQNEPRRDFKDPVKDIWPAFMTIFFSKLSFLTGACIKLFSNDDILFFFFKWISENFQFKQSNKNLKYAYIWAESFFKNFNWIYRVIKTGLNADACNLYVLWCFGVYTILLATSISQTRFALVNNCVLRLRRICELETVRGKNLFYFLNILLLPYFYFASKSTQMILDC